MFVPNSSTVFVIMRAALLLVSFAGFALGQSVETYTVTGRVIDAVSGQPIANAHFVFGQPANNTNNGGFVSFTIGQTNTAGEFRLRLKPGHYALYMSSSVDRTDLYSDVLSF